MPLQLGAHDYLLEKGGGLFFWYSSSSEVGGGPYKGALSWRQGLARVPALMLLVLVAAAGAGDPLPLLESGWQRHWQENLPLHKTSIMLPFIPCIGGLAAKMTHPPHDFLRVLCAGYASVIPGFPRYAMLGDASRGVYNLRISNASLEDDAEFQCQVGPKGRIAAIRANATLTVLCKYLLKVTERKHAIVQYCVMQRLFIRFVGSDFFFIANFFFQRIYR